MGELARKDTREHIATLAAMVDCKRVIAALRVAVEELSALERRDAILAVERELTREGVDLDA